jgi:hypothetical protein
MPSPRRFAFLSSVTCLFVLCLGLPADAQTPAMVEFFSSGKLRKGLPLVDLAHEMIVVSRDGWMHSLDPREPDTKIRSLEEQFRPATAVEMRNELRAEFGKNFDIVSTNSFLVVQPRGRGNLWPDTFESSHRTFLSYMSRRGVKVRQGRFPMVAIVLPDERAMYMEFKKLGIDMKRVAGLYSGESNRVMTHDGGQLASVAATVRHEAAHQSAFNAGIHSRVNDTPRWITEGVGQMFEPPAMVDAAGATQLVDRINQDSISVINAKRSDRHDVWFSQTVMQLVSDDTMFANQGQVSEAYAVAWAMMFYLAERQTREFADLLNHTAGRTPFKEYTRTQRLQDFERIVGSDTFEFSKRVGWFLQSM